MTLASEIRKANGAWTIVCSSGERRETLAMPSVRYSANAAIDFAIDAIDG
jgi:chemotaxis methyl-accepting protein methylase